MSELMPKKKEMACAQKEYIVHEQDLHDLRLSCPTDEMALWNAHPKVYFPIEETGIAHCPYCGSKFVLEK